MAKGRAVTQVSHKSSKRVGLAVIVLCFLGAFISLMMLDPKPRNLMIPYEPQWLAAKSEEEQKTVFTVSAILLGGLGFIAVMIRLINGVFGLIDKGVVAIERYDNTPIPTEYVPAPEPPALEEGEPWRRATGFRYLEKLKKKVAASEKLIRQLYQEAAEAHRELRESEGFIEYTSLRSTVTTNVDEIGELQEELTSLKEHVSKVFAGDVRSDLQELEETVEKLKLKKENEEADAREAEAKIARERDTGELRWLGVRRNELRDSIRGIDVELIEVASGIKELREFDFQKLYQEIGVSPETMRVEIARLSDIKTKADIVAQIKPHAKDGQKTEDQRKMDASKARRRQDIEFGVELSLGTDLQTLEAIQTWRREQRRRVLVDEVATADEKEERLEQIDRAVEREKNRIRKNIDIYEEE